MKISFTCMLALSFLYSYAQPGTLDKTFGKEGKVSLPFSFSVSNGTLLKDDNILALSYHTMTKFLPDGSVNHSFGVDGTVTFEAGISYAFNVSEQVDGKIIVGGYKIADLNNLSLYRYNADGSIDETFGINGNVETDLGGEEYLYALTITPNGQILAGGVWYEYYPNTEYPFIIRYNEDGSVDKTFGKNGSWIFSDRTGHINSIAVNKDAMIIAGGSFFQNNQRYMLTRFTSEGIPDTSFGKEGLAGNTNMVVIQPDGKIIAAGAYGIGLSNVYISRFNNNGSVDKDFGVNGDVKLPFNYALNVAAALQNNGKIVAAAPSGTTAYDFGVARLLPDGSFDKEFGDNGVTVTDIGYNDWLHNVYIQKDGKIVASGGSDNVPGTDYAISLARYLGDPINLITKATIKRWIKNHILNWQATVSNNDISYYAIEGSQSGTAGFIQIAKVKANKVQPNAATAIYAYNLASNAAANSTATNYYRIRAVNTDGSFVYSDVVSDAGLQTGSAFTVSPNPARDVLKVSGLPANEKTVVNIVNRNGNVLQTVTAQSSAININVSALHSGLYNIKRSNKR